MNILNMEIIIGVLFVLFLLVIALAVGVLRAPVMRLSNEEKEKIKQNGLIHFTKTEHIESIRQYGLYGSTSSMGIELVLKEMVWMYLYESLDHARIKQRELKNTGNAKKDSSMYSACLRITGFSDNDIDQMSIRKFPKRWGVIGDNAIVYRGKILKPKQIEVIFRE
ncbi:MAG: hypothetical protein ACI4TK_18920 [Agathobacter sp.]